MKPDLLPCPFCGGEAKLFPEGDWFGAFATCESCDIGVGHETDEGAIAKWNRRVPAEGGE